MLCGWEVCYACQLLREGELCWKKEIKKNTGRLHLLYCQEDFNYIFIVFQFFLWNHIFFAASSSNILLLIFVI